MRKQYCRFDICKLVVNIIGCQGSFKDSKSIKIIFKLKYSHQLQYCKQRFGGTTSGAGTINLETKYSSFCQTVEALWENLQPIFSHKIAFSYSCFYIKISFLFVGNAMKKQIILFSFYFFILLVWLRNTKLLVQVN